MPNFAIERRCAGIVCGIDEVGRGPLAGPVVAAAVILDQKRFPRSLRERLDDSKVLTIDEREACWKALGRCVERGAAHIAIGAASVREIDTHQHSTRGIAGDGARRRGAEECPPKSRWSTATCRRRSAAR